MTVELLPLELLDWLVMVVSVVKAESVEGEVSRALTTSSTARWSSSGPSSSDDDPPELLLRWEDPWCRGRGRDRDPDPDPDPSEPLFSLLSLLSLLSLGYIPTGLLGSLFEVDLELCFPDVDLCVFLCLAFSFREPPPFIFGSGGDGLDCRRVVSFGDSSRLFLDCSCDSPSESSMMDSHEGRVYLVVMVRGI